MNFNILTLFPDFFNSCFKVGLLGRALEKSLIRTELVDIKKFGKKGRADDYPFGGGGSMLLAYPYLKSALQSVKNKGRVIYLSPQGEPWTAVKAKNYSQKHKSLTLICGRYGGLDTRFIQDFVDEEISVGDYILNGGETGALVLIESLCRFLDGFLGNEESFQEESFENSLLKGPSWTKPRDIEGHKLPELIFSGDHKKIKQLRFYTSLLLTHLKRPDLLEAKEELLNQKETAEAFLLQFSSEELKALGFVKKQNQILLYK